MLRPVLGSTLRWRPPLLAAALLLAGACPAAAQIVRGTVLSEGAEQRVAGARVSVLTEATGAVVTEQLSSDGAFQIDVRQPGRYRLRVQALGYATTTTEPLELGAGALLTVEVRLRADAIALEPLRVVAERWEPLFMRDVRDRRRMGFGRLLTREDLDQRFGSRLDDVLRDAGLAIEYVALGQQQVPLVSGRQSTARVLHGAGCYAALYVNGMRHFPSVMRPAAAGRTQDGTGIFDIPALQAVLDFFTFRPQELEAVEIYRSRSEAPAEWADDMSECGVVAIWLRQDRDRGVRTAYTGPWPNAALNLAGGSYRLTGSDAPAPGTAFEAAVQWRLRGRYTAGARLRRSVHTLSAEATEELMRGMNPLFFDLSPGPRPMSLYVLSVEPRVELLRAARVTPSVTLRLLAAHRRFEVDDPWAAGRSYRFSSLGAGIGAAAGVEVHIARGVAFELSAAQERIGFGGYGPLEGPDKRTGSWWTANGWRLGFTTRL
jgi:hypothetical protein